ncbi:beta and beta-prime subunits of DNA dependent RNA-polymerase [Panus rudis PR-1116 ss-1]|nr:beta and beta-prime subunits of DNA dependent RNA-polymerase [Panus rudis PR-1116 ss-1]
MRKGNIIPPDQLWNYCKSKMVCEADEPRDENDNANADEPKKGHGGCGATQPLVQKEGLKSFVRYQRSKDEDEVWVRHLGLSDKYAHLTRMILTVLPAPPPPVRPSISVDGGVMRSEDDSTSVLRRTIAGIPQAVQKPGRPINAIRACLKGKQDRQHGDLMGKRVDYSARIVITGDPNLELDEVGVPGSIAMNLTFPERGRVTPHNVAYLQDLVRIGPTAYPGVRCVVKDTGERIDSRYNKCADAFLQYGWIIEGHLKDAIFNEAFRLSLSATPPYNVHFDGDDMNMHVPRNEETCAELDQIAWIISSQANKPLMGIAPNTLCGIRQSTLWDCFLDWNQVQNILLWICDWDGSISTPAIIKLIPLWTGKHIFSTCIPRGINIHRSPGPKFVNPVFDVDQHLSSNGFSVGIGDALPDKKMMEHITERNAIRILNVSRTARTFEHDLPVDVTDSSGVSGSG